MNTLKKRQNVLLAISSIVLMTGGGLLLNQTLNFYYNTLSAFIVILLSILSVIIFVVGASLMGRCVNINNVRHYRNGMSNSIIFALVLVATGMLLLGFNTAYFPSAWNGFFFSWPMLLLVIGIVHFCNCHFLWGIILAAIGKFFLFTKVSVLFPEEAIYEQFASTYWPVLIIVCGVAIFLSTILSFGKRSITCSKSKWKENNTSEESENNDGKINYRFIFSGSEQVILDPIFKGGNIDITFGGMDLDLSRTSLAEGDTFMYINVVFGGIEITVPDHWDIEIRQNRIAGGIEDSRKNKNTEIDRTRKLIVVAKCTFGGIDIK